MFMCTFNGQSILTKILSCIECEKITFEISVNELVINISFDFRGSTIKDYGRCSYDIIKAVDEKIMLLQVLSLKQSE